MIKDEKVLGLSMSSRRQRRQLVVLYCIFISSLAAVGIYAPKSFLPAMVCQCVLLGGMLGGIRGYGPVKRYEGNQFPSDDFTRTTASFPVQTLNLNDQLPLVADPLDEREHAERDRAHYVAYRLLRIAIPFFCLAYAFALETCPAPTARATPGLLWWGVLLVLSLPQNIILWTEPEVAGEGPRLLLRKPA